MLGWAYFNTHPLGIQWTHLSLWIAFSAIGTVFVVHTSFHKKTNKLYYIKKKLAILTHVGTGPTHCSREYCKSVQLFFFLINGFYTEYKVYTIKCILNITKKKDANKAREKERVLTHCDNGWETREMVNTKNKYNIKYKYKFLWNHHIGFTINS